MTTQNLIPGSNFQVKKLDRIRFNSPCKKFHVLASGYGLWDLSVKGWVSMNSFFNTDLGSFPAPYSPLGGKKALKQICQSGLYEGYSIVKND